MLRYATLCYAMLCYATLYVVLITLLTFLASSVQKHKTTTRALILGTVDCADQVIVLTAKGTLSPGIKCFKGHFLLDDIVAHILPKAYTVCIDAAIQNTGLRLAYANAQEREVFGLVSDTCTGLTGATRAPDTQAHTQAQVISIVDLGILVAYLNSTRTYNRIIKELGTYPQTREYMRQASSATTEYNRKPCGTYTYYTLRSTSHIVLILSLVCLAYVLHMSHTCLAYVLHMSCICLTHVSCAQRKSLAIGHSTSTGKPTRANKRTRLYKRC